MLCKKKGLIYTVSSKKEEKSETRNRILEATQKLLEGPDTSVPGMADVAAQAGISRQAVYLLFSSRADLLIETIRFIDERNGLPERLSALQAIESGIERLDRCVHVWGEYLPEIQGISRALLMLRDSDPEVMEAWDETVRCLSDVCRDCLTTLKNQGLLASEWTVPKATIMLTGMLSIPCWEELQRLGWSNREYIKSLKLSVRKTFCAPQEREE